MWKALIKIVEKKSCNHSWKEADKIEVVDDYGNYGGKYNKFIFICENCGKITKVIN